MFKVTHGKVKFKGVLYGKNEEAGDMISGLSPEQEKSLVQKGYGEIIKAKEEVYIEEGTNDIPDISEMNVGKAQKIIEEINDSKILNTLKKIELHNKKRKTVIEAIETKIIELESDEKETHDVNIDFNPDDVIKG